MRLLFVDSFIRTRVQQVHVVTVLTDGVFNASHVQPADYHTEELETEGDKGKLSIGRQVTIDRLKCPVLSVCCV